MLLLLLFSTPCNDNGSVQPFCNKHMLSGSIATTVDGEWSAQVDKDKWPIRFFSVSWTVCNEEVNESNCSSTDDADGSEGECVEANLIVITWECYIWLALVLMIAVEVLVIALLSLELFLFLFTAAAEVELMSSLCNVTD